MIKLEHATKIFHANTAGEVKALNHIDLEIKAEEFVVVIGSNGSGKSTLLNAIAGTFVLSSGGIFFNDLNVTAQKDFERSGFVARVFQNPLMGTAPDLSILDNFRLAALRSKSKRLQTGIDKNFAASVREKVGMLGIGIEKNIDRKMSSLSGGQRQALTLLMAVMDDAKVLLMDEPTAALDPKSAETVIQVAVKIISEYKLTAMLVTHNMKDAHRFGNRIIQMGEGKIWRDLQGNNKEALQINELYSWFE